MTDADAGRFTVGVFQDAAWADKGLQALKAAGLPAESLTVLAKASPDVDALIARHLGGSGEHLDIAALGPSVARGPLTRVLQGTAADLATLGLSGTLRRAGFQPHDGRIYEALTEKGGVLVAIHSEPRAADSLAVLLSYGGGNAAIGAWSGRV